LARAQREGRLVEGVAPYQEGVVLWSIVDAQSTGIVLGERSADDAIVTVDYYLDRLFVPES
jgi:hypothetical protein